MRKSNAASRITMATRRITANICETARSGKKNDTFRDMDGDRIKIMKKTFKNRMNLHLHL
jgi:hypothetical protein